MDCIKLLSSTVVEMQPPHRIVKASRPKKKKRFTYEPKRQCVGCGGKGHFLSTCTKIEVGRVCENLKKKVKKVVQEKCEQWTGEMNPNPNPNPSDINVTFAEIDDEIDNDNVNDSGSENSADEDVDDY